MQRPEPTLRLLAAGSSSWRAGAGVGCVCADTRAVGYWTRWGTRVWLAILEPCLEGKSDGDGYVLAFRPPDRGTDCVALVRGLSSVYAESPVRLEAGGYAPACT
jgi:hypothetical protein